MTATREVRARALELGAIDAATEAISEAVSGADVVFVATPLSAIAETVAGALEQRRAGLRRQRRRLHQAPARRGRLPTSASSAATRWPAPRRAGVEHAREDLFEGATWYLTPARGSTAGVLYERLHRLLSSFGARPDGDRPGHPRPPDGVRLAPAPRARQRARRAGRRPARRRKAPQRLPAVGPSFRDATRVAGANTRIWTDIYLSNRDALVAGIDELLERLQEVRAWLAEGDGGALGDWNERARAAREALLGAASWGGPVQELRASVPEPARA